MWDTVSTSLFKTYVPAASNSNITQQRPESASNSAGKENLRHKPSEEGRL
jgi:hypothetical protein